ncbi:lipid II flippase family protein [Thermodesulfobacteriota bacterium]
MDHTLILLVIFTFVIHLVGTLAYSARIAGSRTGRIAVSFALFNIMMLCSRTSNSFQGPILAKRIEENLACAVSSNTAHDFRILLLSASMATLIGVLLTPTFQRLFTLAVNKFSDYRSIPGFAGTLLSQLLFIPAAMLIVFVAEII